MIIMVLCILCFFFILVACTSKKKEENQIPEQDVEMVQETDEESLPIQKINEDYSSIKNTEREKDENDTIRDTFKLEQEKQPETKNSYTIGSQRYLSFLPQIPGSCIYPQDFTIGSLYNEGDSSQEARFIEEIISDFLVSLKESKIETSLLYEGEESGLYRFLTFHLEMMNIPQKYRIGKIVIEETDTGYTFVRIFGKKGKTDGEIYVKKKENKWYISDIQLNFDELEVPAEKNEEKFMPTTYQWIIQGM
ncbi:MAG: hypothetical protein JXB88_09770 [Spirochaetales bacterium]|nr:hypothetical protein [Spirochaetales bacterium]